MGDKQRGWFHALLFMAIAIAVLAIPRILDASAVRHFTGQVISVKSGDTIVVETLYKRYTVRLAAIDAPELAQPFGKLRWQRIAQ